MDAVTVNLDHVLAWCPGFMRSWIAATSAGFGSGLVTGTLTTNILLALGISAISSALVAYFTSRPRYAKVQADAKISESELVSKRMSEHITRLEKTGSQNLEIIRLQVEARHDIANFLAPLQHNYDYVCMLARDAGKTLPADLPDIATKIRQRVRQLDKDIFEVMHPGVIRREDTTT
jgi:hypothetical protein